MLWRYRASAMRNHKWIAFAALAFGGLALSPMSAALAQRAAEANGVKPKAQTVDEADANSNFAENAAPADGEAVAAEPLPLADTVAQALRPSSEAAMRV